MQIYVHGLLEYTAMNLYAKFDFNGPLIKGDIRILNPCYFIGYYIDDVIIYANLCTYVLAYYLLILSTKFEVNMTVS